MLTIVKDICSLKQICTQSGGLRPFGVSILVAGIDAGGPRLFETDPTGIYFEYKATAIGEAEPEIEEILNKNYREDMTTEEGLKLAIGALVTVLDKKFNVDRIDAAIILTEDQTYKKVDKAKVEKVLKDIKRK